jgi:hypothetical protein
MKAIVPTTSEELQVGQIKTEKLYAPIICGAKRFLNDEGCIILAIGILCFTSHFVISIRAYFT